MKHIKNISIILTTACLLFCSVQNASSDSFYSAMGLGLPYYYVSSKAVGMGGAGLGVTDRYALNAMNTAALDVKGLTTISVNSYYDVTISDVNGESIWTRNGNPAGFHFAIPVKKQILFLISVKSLTTSKYTLSTANSTEYVNYTRLVRGNGGLSAGSLGMQYRVNDWLKIGANANFNFGTFSEEWKTEFDDDSYVEASDKIVSHLWGVSYDFSALVNATPKLSLGVVFKGKSNMHLENKTTLGSAKQYDLFNSKLDYPYSFGLGAAYQVSRVLVALDFYEQLWQEYRESRNNNYQNFWRLSGGLEYLDTDAMLANYHRRIAYRFGYYYSSLPFNDFTGHNITEQFVSIGICLPFHKYYGRVDFAVEAGKRAGTDPNSFNETIIRFTGSITGSELWFQRRH